MLSNKLFSSIGNTDRLYVDDVFSAYTYTGNGTTQTITNGIDLAGKGGLVWGKSRSGTWGAAHHKLVDTARGPDKTLSTSTTSPENTSSQTLTAFSSSGFSLGTSAELNGTGTNYVSWTFRKAPKFFDVVTYTGNGAGSRSIAHSLGVAPGMVIVRQTDTASNWLVLARKSDGTWAYGSSPYSFKLNTTEPAISRASVTTDTSFFAIQDIANGSADTNANGASYVAYLFAHDPSADGIVQCGSYVANGSASGPIINLGWEPQYVMIKRAVGGTGNWILLDSMRGMPVGGNDATLCANSSGAENGVLIGNLISPTATGFQITDNSPEVNGSASDTYLYLAIRRPNKPPTTGTQVYNAIAFAGNSTGSTKQTLATSLSPDAVLLRNYLSYSTDIKMYDRLRGDGSRLRTNLPNVQIAGSAVFCSFTSSMQFTVGPDPEDNPGYNDGESVAWAFKRAPGFFDVVCRSGTGTSAFTRVDVNHSLGAVPELIIYKCRSNTSGWIVGIFNPSSPTSNGYGQLNQTYAIGSASFPGNFLYAAPTATQFSFWDANGFDLNTSGHTYVAYLFASLPGISKVGSYTGNGSSQTINCGFSTGARFILLKRTDSTGDWYVWDTARGIIAANDPHLSLNTTAAEVTTNDSVDPDSTGFIVNQVAATNINVNGATYIFLSIA